MEGIATFSDGATVSLILSHFLKAYGMNVDTYMFLRRIKTPVCTVVTKRSQGPTAPFRGNLPRSPLPELLGFGDSLARARRSLLSQMAQIATRCLAAQRRARAWGLTPPAPPQVRQAAAAPARPALHRPQVPGAPLLLQAHRGHAHRHLPHGDAGGPAPADLGPPRPARARPPGPGARPRHCSA